MTTAGRDGRDQWQVSSIFLPSTAGRKIEDRHTHRTFHLDERTTLQINNCKRLFVRIEEFLLPNTWNAVEQGDTITVENESGPVTVQLPTGNPDVETIVETLNADATFALSYQAVFLLSSQTINITNATQAFVVSGTGRGLTVCGLQDQQASTNIDGIETAVGTLPDIVRYPALYICSKSFIIRSDSVSFTDPVLAQIDTLDRPAYSQTRLKDAPWHQLLFIPRSIEQIELRILDAAGNDIDIQGRPWFAHIQFRVERLFETRA